MPTPGKKTLSAAALALAASLGIVAGHVLRAKAEATTSVIDFEVRAHPETTWSMTAHALVCIDQGEGLAPACAVTHFEVPMTPDLVTTLSAVRDAAQAVYEAKQAAPEK